MDKLCRGFLPFAIVSAALAACTGSIGDSDGSSPHGPSGTGPGPGTSTSAVCNGEPAVGPSPLRRLTRTEYDNTVRDLLGVDLKVGETFPADQSVLGFDNNVTGMSVTTTLAEQLMLGAETVATAAAPRAKTLAGCDPVSAGETACARQLAEKLARRAFRMKPTTEQIDALVAAFNARATPTFEGGAKSMIALVLQAPFFLYRVELGSLPTAEEGIVQLDDYAMASRLSYFCWGSMPDDALFAAAEKGELRTPEQIATQARRMLKDSRARAVVANFHRQWLELDSLDELPKDATTYPQFDDAMRRDLRAEVDAFLDNVFWRDGHLETLWTAPYTYANAKVASIYGVSAPAGSGFVQVALDPTKRPGLLTRASILALHAPPDDAAPIYRGKFVRERILCQDMPPPPEGLVVVPPEPDKTKSVRQRYTEHSANAACSGCHQLMDPIGFGFGHFDDIGRWRDVDGPGPVDAHGEIKGETDIDGPFNGAAELSARIAKSDQVAGCMVKQWFRYAHGRGETDIDRCTIESLRKTFSSTKHDLRELLVAITQTRAFRFRTVER